MQISYSSTGFFDRSLDEALERIGEAGFTHVELVGMDPHLGEVPTGTALHQLKQKLDSTGVSAGTLHAPLLRNVLGAPEEGWRATQVGVSVDYLRLSAEVGAAGMIIHPVPNPRFVDDPDDPDLPDVMRTAARRSLDDLIPVAQETGVRMLLENLPYSIDFPLLTMTELRALVDPYPHDAVGLVIDTGHAWTGGHDPVDEIAEAGERLWGTHLQDVDGENPQDNHWAPTHGDLDWPAIRQALVDVGYGGHWTFEIARPRDGHDESFEELARITYEVALDLRLHG